MTLPIIQECADEFKTYVFGIEDFNEIPGVQVFTKINVIMQATTSTGQISGLIHLLEDRLQALPEESQERFEYQSLLVKCQTIQKTLEQTRKNLLEIVQAW